MRGLFFQSESLSSLGGALAIGAKDSKLPANEGRLRPVTGRVGSASALFGLPETELLERRRLPDEDLRLVAELVEPRVLSLSSSSKISGCMATISCAEELRRSLGCAVGSR